MTGVLTCALPIFKETAKIYDLQDPSAKMSKSAATTEIYTLSLHDALPI